MLGIVTQHNHDPLPTDNLTIFAHLFYGSSYFHTWLSTINNSALGEVIGRHFHQHGVARQDANFIHAHFTGQVRQHLMAIAENDLKMGVGKQFFYFPLQFKKTFFIRFPDISITLGLFRLLGWRR